MNPYLNLLGLLLLGALNLGLGILFMARLRPRLRQYFSQRLGVPLRDGYDGAWKVGPPGSWREGCLISLLDITTLILALMGPLGCSLLMLFCLIGEC